MADEPLSLQALIHRRLVDLKMTVSDAERVIFGKVNNRIRLIFDRDRVSSKMFMKLVTGLSISKDPALLYTWLTAYLVEEFGQEDGQALLRNCGLEPMISDNTAPEGPAWVLRTNLVKLATVCLPLLEYLDACKEPALCSDLAAVIKRTGREMRWPLSKMGTEGWIQRNRHRGAVVDPRSNTSYTGQYSSWQITEAGRQAIVDIKLKLSESAGTMQPATAPTLVPKSTVTPASPVTPVVR